MSTTTSIEWTRGDDGTPGTTWNPIRGCSRISRGCGAADGGGCYAERLAARFSGPGRPYDGLVRLGKNGPRWTGRMAMAPVDTLLAPLRWRTPRRVFVNSMSDLFHENLGDDEIDRVFAVMLISALHATRGGHTFQILTKRTERMAYYSLAAPGRADDIAAAAGRLMEDGDAWNDTVFARVRKHGVVHPTIWLGTSVEDQRAADGRLPHLTRTAAAVRFVSAEPLLGPIDLRLPAAVRGWKPLHWLIAGAESGPRARPMDEDWVRSLRDQCSSADVPFFYKQKATDGRKIATPRLDGRKWMQFPRPDGARPPPDRPFL